MKTKVLNTKIDCLKEKELKELLRQGLAGDKPIRVGKVNPEFLLKAHNLSRFEKVLNEFELVIADGTGVLWAAKYLSLPLTSFPVFRQIQAIYQWVITSASLIFYPKYCAHPIPERFPGLDAFYLMLEVCAETGKSVYLFGAGKETVKKAVSSLETKYPDLKIAGWHDGYDFTDEEMIAEINRKQPKLLVVALGNPKQEYWITDNIAKLSSVRIAVGEGGTLEYIGGGNRRAPKWMSRIGLEWFWRIGMNKDMTGNSRLKRVWQAVPVFMYTVVREKIKNGASVE